jgi:hypothetical protein
MSVDDFVLNWKKVRGQVTITGRAGCINTTCYLYNKHLTPELMFNTEHLPLKDRRRLLECNPLTIPCNIALTGYGGADLLHPVGTLSTKSQPRVSFIVAHRQSGRGFRFDAGHRIEFVVEHRLVGQPGDGFGS